MTTINLTLEKPKEVSSVLKKEALDFYKTVNIENVTIEEKYTFILPEFELNDIEDFFILQSYKGLLYATDQHNLINYGYKELKDFKIYLHNSFYNKKTDIVIFTQGNNKDYGILYKNVIYHKPNFYKYSPDFIDLKDLLKHAKFNRYYKLKDKKEQYFCIDKCKYENKPLKTDYSKMFYLKALHFEYIDYGKEIKFLHINKYNIKYFNSFYIDEDKRFAISEINI